MAARSFVLAAAALLACSPAAAAERAQELAQRFLLVDTHIDVPDRLQQKMEDVGLATSGGEFDHPRARQGGLDVAFMSIYVPASYQERGGAKHYADELIDLVERIVAGHPDKFARVTSPKEARRCAAIGKVGLALGMENGAPVEDDLANLRHFHQRGVRYITLTHGKNNQIGDSSYDTVRRWHGLSSFGRKVVAEMNRLGIMVDVSHVSDETFAQVVALSRAPLIASHSSCRHFTPGWERNMSDAMIRQLAARGGVIQINFGNAFLDDEHRRASERHRAEILRYLEEHQLAEDAEEAKRYAVAYLKEHALPPLDVAQVADHIDHVRRLVGVDHVGLGSDFDGVQGDLPRGLQSVADYPNLIAELLARGYAERDVAKICGGNLLRVWGDVERVAHQLQVRR
ncbi:MAG TPA: dipeptidase [Candidatus Polarisedimenticolaceae bacterium]|nr:dipeptidase [Candidatus Polarisedimenticolaceae bacterium]